MVEGYSPGSDAQLCGVFVGWGLGGRLGNGSPQSS